MADLGVFPAPREVVDHDPSVRSDRPLRIVSDASLPAEGYELRVDADDALLVCADDAGRRHGEATVGQLRRADETLPQVHLRDHPSVPNRGFMLDISRARVPTRDTLARLVEVLALARYNHLQLYVEHAFAYTGHDDVWGEASPLDGDDLRWLDDRCRSHGIELAGNQNCFGHMERWLRVERHRHRAECPQGWEHPPGVRRRPGVLAPTDENAAFVRALVEEQLSHLRTNTVNVGCDETFELGRGVSGDEVAARGLGAVYATHLHRIIDPLLERGLDVQFWGDVARSHPEVLASLPSDGVTCLAWTYEAPPTGARAAISGVDDLGIDADAHQGFERQARPFVDAGVDFWLVPGTSTWNSLVGRWDNAEANLRDAVEHAVRLGSGGVLVTDWGDNGHLQPPSVSWPPLLLGGALAWCPESNADIDVAQAIDERVVLDPTGTIGRVLCDVGVQWGRTGQTAYNSSPLQAALCPHQFHAVLGEPDGDRTSEVVRALEDARARLDGARPASADADDVVHELGVAIGLAHHGAERLRSRTGAGAPPDPDTLVHLREEHRKAWLRRSRPGGLAYSLRQLDRTIDADGRSPA